MLNRVLLVGTLLFSIALASLVFLVPLLPAESHNPLVRLIAADVAVRRTALACAAGLAVTALVFFRNRRSAPLKPEPEISEIEQRRETKPKKRNRSRPVIGA